VLETGKGIRNVPVVGLPPRTGSVVREWLTSYYPIRAEGQTTAVGLVAVDVTDRMRAERLRTAVMSQVTDGVYTEDAHGRLTSMNRAASRMLGWTEAELRGRPTHDDIHFQTAGGNPVPADRCLVRAAIRSGSLMRAVDETFTRKDGTVFPVALTAFPLRLGSMVEGVAVIFRDLSPVPVARRVIRVLMASADERSVQAAGALLDAHEGTEVVAIATSPAETVALAQARRPDIALVDYKLPELDGLETAARLRDSAPKVKTLLVLDDFDEELVLAAVDAGCNGVLAKSRGWAELIAAVEAADQGGTVMSQDELAGVIASARGQEPEGRTADRPKPRINLTERESEVLACISQGLSNKQVAERLGLTVNTVRNHVQRLLYKLHAHSKLEAVVAATHEGVLPGSLDPPK
jgi:PAS domain S-box-containing protein